MMLFASGAAYLLADTQSISDVPDSFIWLGRGADLVGILLGTVIGALIISVIQNGMNLTGVESYTQKVVLGLVILGAVLADKLKRGGFR